jgi:uncharacterized membrane protein/YHS domain-containing protein
MIIPDTAVTKRHRMTISSPNSSLSQGVKTARLGARLFRQSKVLLLASTFALSLVLNIMASPVNSLCPVTTDEPVDSTITVTFEGQEIAFCCQKCRRQFLAYPQKFVSNLAQLASSVPTDGNGAHDHTNEHGQMGTDSLQPDSLTASMSEHSDSDPMAVHNHGTDHDRPSNRLIAYLGKFHPVVVHFPVAILLTAFLVVLFGVLKPSTTNDLLGYKLTYIAAVGAGLAAILGLAAGSNVHYPAELAEYFTKHRLLGLGTAAFNLLIAIAAYRVERRRSVGRLWLFRLLLLLGAIAVAITAHLGATLVYGPDHFAF